MLILVGTIAILLLALLYALSQVILIDSFVQLEQNEVKQDTGRVSNALQSELAELNTTTSDWARWDDSYQFIQDHNEAYIQSNLGDETFINLGLNVIVYFDSSDQVVYGKTLLPGATQAVQFTPLVVEEYLSTNSLLGHYDEITDPKTEQVSGIVLTPLGPMLVSAQPIRHSNGAGALGGSLLMGRYLDAARIAFVAELTDVTLDLWYIDDPTLPADYQTALDHLSPQTMAFSQPLDNNTFAGYTLLEDIAGQPMLILRVEMPRDISHEGRDTVQFFLLAATLLALILVIAAASTIDRVILARVERIGQAIRRIGQTGDMHTRVPASGNDELADLGSYLNDMLDAFKRAQDTLWSSEARYRALFENANDAIFLMRADECIDCNPRALEMFGCVRNQIINHKPYDAYFSPPIQPDGRNTREKVLEKINLVLGGKPQRFEWRHIRYDGTPFEAEVTLNQLELSGEMLIQAMVRDITERKRAADALRESEEQFSNLFNRIPVNLYRTTPDGQLVVANPALMTLLGYPDLETLRSGTVDKFYVDAAERERFRHVIQCDGIIEGFQTRLYRYDGSIIWIEDTARMVCGAQGDVLYYEGALKDITTQKQAEDALRESEERFQYALHAAELGLWDWIVPENKVFINQRYADITGYSAEEILTSPGWWRASLHPDDAPPMLAQREAYLAGQTDFFEGEYRLFSKTGAWKWVSDRAKVVQRDANGTPLRITGTLFDITGRKVIEAERENLLKQMAARASELATVAAISHQITTILDVDKLLWEVSNLIKDQFGFYHAHIYLLDPEGQMLRLAAGAGEVGRELVRHGHALKLDTERSLVVQAARQRETVLENNVSQAPTFMPNPFLAKTQSEMAIPMLTGDTLIGVLDVQADTVDRFGPEDVNIQTTLAAQAAIAIHNARLFTALHQANRAYQVLSNCNQAMVRANDEESLLREICNIIVETGQYRFAWVSYTRQDDPDNIYPTAFAGHDDGYLSATLPLYQDTTIPPGPIHIAIHSRPDSDRA